jgi:hypothetical protein
MFYFGLVATFNADRSIDLIFNNRLPARVRARSCSIMMKPDLYLRSIVTPESIEVVGEKDRLPPARYANGSSQQWQRSS